MNRLVKISVNLQNIQEQDYLIAVEEYDGQYHNYYNLIKQDNCDIENKEDNHYVFQNWWHNNGIDCGYDAYGYEYYVTIKDLMDIKEKLPKEFIEKLYNLMECY